MMIALVEDHNEVLKIWRQKGIKNLDLVHIDAHMDFGFHFAKPPLQVIKEARTVKDLKTSLERSLMFNRYENDFEKQTNIGNYIYPAMRDGLVRDFYWVVPGGNKEFKQSRKQLKALIKSLRKQDPYALQQSPEDKAQKIEYAIDASLMGRRFVITNLEHLPVFNKNRKVLLDIDADFLVVDSLKNANPTSMVGRRNPWIEPEDLVNILQKKIKRPVFTTIAYSVNGGFTPMNYKYLGDQIAYYLAPQHFDGQLKRNLKAAEYFTLFESTGRKQYYEQAIRLNPTYRAQDNNYGPLYLNCQKPSRAKDEFAKIIKVDPKNPDALTGLGKIYLQKMDYSRARRCFQAALKEKKGLGQAIFGLAQIEFKSANLIKAKRLLKEQRAFKAMPGPTNNLLGDIYRKERRWQDAVMAYKKAIDQGALGIDIFIKLLKISNHIDEKDGIISFVTAKYQCLKRRFYLTKKFHLQRPQGVQYFVRFQRELKKWKN